MLQIIQIITILQGLFLVLVLSQRRQAYKKTTFILFVGCLISIILFAIGDDEYNLVANNASWFFFHEPLMITFFFLFIRYSNAKESTFKKSDALFFLPYCLFIFFETITEFNHFSQSSILNFCENLVEFFFFGMLLYSIYDILKNQKEKWLLVFIVPFTLAFAIDEVAKLTINTQESFFYLG